jgi:hypothetical protein
MNVSELFLTFHQDSLKSYGQRLFDRLTEAQMRSRPQPGLNSIAWLLWHMARCEDAGLNRLVAVRTQVFDEGNWGERLHVPLRHHGTGMTDQEVTALSQHINLSSLQVYYEAVRARTVEVVQGLLPAQLDEVNDIAHLRHVLVDEGVFNPIFSLGDPLPYQGKSKGVLLFHFAMNHNYGHFYEAATICSLLGVNFWS